MNIISEQSRMASDLRIFRKVNDKEAKKVFRVAAYCRVSTDMKIQESSLETQMSSFYRRINENPDWTLVGIYSDATVIIGLKQNPTIGRRFSPIFSFIEHLSGKYGRCYT